MSSALLRLMGDVVKDPFVADLVIAANEVITANLPLERMIVKRDSKKKKLRLIQPGLQPGKILRVGGVGEQKQRRRKIRGGRWVPPTPPPTDSSVGQQAIPYDALAIGEAWITKDGRHILIGDPAHENSTMHEFLHNGKWDASRDAMHEKIVDKAVAGKHEVEGRKPIATILGGGTASGKTSASRKIMGDDKNVLRVDPDEVKLSVPEYAGLKKSDPEHAAMRVHDESGYITSRIMAKAIDNKLDLTYDATTSGNGGVQMARTLLANGYDVRVMFFDIPITQAIGRQQLREATSTDPINAGRVVPTDIIRETHYGSAAKFHELVTLPGLTSVRLYDNSRGTQSHPEPRLVYEKVGGKETVYDQERFNQHKEKAIGIGEASSLDRQRSSAYGYSAGRRQLVENDRSREGQEALEESFSLKVKGRRKPVAVPRRKNVNVAFVNQLGQRFWIGTGGGFRSQYGDYNQAERPRLRLVAEKKAKTGGV